MAEKISLRLDYDVTGKSVVELREKKELLESSLADKYLTDGARRDNQTLLGRIAFELRYRDGEFDELLATLATKVEETSAQQETDVVFLEPAVV